MALANKLGLTDKVVSERHFYASQEKQTAGEAAKNIAKAVKRKVSAKNLREMYDLYYHHEMEWHHSGFHKGTYGKTRGRTFFISKEEIQEIIDNFDMIYEKFEQSQAYESEKVYAIYWEWQELSRTNRRQPKWAKTLQVYEGERRMLPRNSTECTKAVYIEAMKAVGRIYEGWDTPTIEEFERKAV